MIQRTTSHPEITVDGGQPAKPLRRFYSATGYANADFTYTAPFRRMYDYLSSYHNHLYYMRLHNILTLHGDGDKYFLDWEMDYGNQRFSHDNRHNGNDKVVETRPDGSLSYNWELVDSVYDIIVGHGMVPIVEMCYMPLAIRKSEEDFILPADYKIYAQVVRAFVEHCVERYGQEGVRTWYFEIWNEPDNHKLWCEDASTFFALYDYMEQAIHQVDSGLKAGGPATKQYEDAYNIFTQFLEHCANGLNYATGTYGTRLDFISVHCKGGWPEAYSPSSEVMFDAVHRYLDILEQYPQFKDTEFFNDESDIVWHGNKGIWENSWLDFRNTHYAPGFVCKMVSRYCTEVVDERGINLAVVDSDNAHLQWERYLFSGNRSQLTPLGEYPCTDIIRKPFFNAYVLLSRLGEERLVAECGDEGYNRKYGVLPTRTGDTLAIMAWNFEDGLGDGVNGRCLHIALKDLGTSGPYCLAEYRIDGEHSNSNSVWHAMGSPENPTQEQIQQLRSREGLELAGPVSKITLGGKTQLDVELPLHGVSLLLLTPETTDAPAAVDMLKAQAEQGSNGKPQVFLKWKPSPALDLLHYKVLRKNGHGDYCVIAGHTSLNTAVFVDMDVEAGQSYTYRIIAVNTSGRESEGGLGMAVNVPGSDGWNR